MKQTVVIVMSLLLVSMAHGLVTESIAGTEKIQVTLINQEPDPVAPGNIVDLRFRIENIGSEPAENVQVKLETKFPFSVYWSEEKVKSIGTIAGGQRDEIGVREKFRLSVDPDATEGSNIVEFWYKRDNGPWVKADEFEIDVRSRDAVLAINEVQTEPEKIFPGTLTKVTFKLENLAESILKDVKLRLDVYTSVVTTSSIQTVELPFTPIGSGNEKTIKSIEPKQSKDITFDLFTDADAASKVYKVPYTLIYEDQLGTNFTREGVVGLIVDAQPELTVSLENTEILSAGQKGTVSIQFVNKGFSDIKFLDVTLEETSDFDVLSNTEVYIGNLDSDDFETADYTLLMNGNGKDQVSLPLTYTYRDANGQLFTKTYAANLPLYSGNELKKRSNGGGGSPVGLIIIVVIVVVGIIIYRRRKKKNKQ